MDGLKDMITCLGLDMVVAYVRVYEDEETGARLGPDTQEVHFILQALYL